MDDASNSVSPSGAYVIDVSMWEARMSLWIETPTVTDQRSGELVLKFADPNWSLDAAQWLDDDTVRMCLRRYPGNRQPADINVELACATRTARVEGGEPMPVDRIEAEMDRMLRSRPLAKTGLLPG